MYNLHQNPLPMRYAAYCRVSTGSDEQLNSLINQKKFFEEYVSKRGDTLVNVYADRGISGKSMERRTEFMRLLSDSKNDLFDAVLVKDISRFARNTLDFLTGIRTLKAQGVDVIFIGANQKVLGESEFILTVFAALAQEESCALSGKIIFGKKQGAKSGRVPNVVYGYDKSDTYTLTINPTEAETVRTIFDLYTEKRMGLRKISSFLNSKNIPAKTGGQWSPKTVGRILSNPLYAGILVNNKTETVDFLLGKRRTVPRENQYRHNRPELALVSEIVFEKARQIRSARFCADTKENNEKHAGC